MSGDLHAYIGPAAGVATSLLWTATSLLFTAAGKRIGPTVLNVFRLVLAVILLGATHRWLTGVWIPPLSTKQVTLLGLSGVLGLAIGDQALFVAFVYIGPRLCLLIMATSPIFAAFVGWVALGETIHGLAWIGIGLAMAGVTWVVLERPEGIAVEHHHYRARGVMLALIASACQAGGLLLSKQGMGHGWLADEQHLDPQAATLVRMVFATLGMMPVIAVHFYRGRKRQADGIQPVRIGSPSAGLWLATGGAVVGPYLGVWMSLVATDRAPLGIAQTLCSLGPVFILPFAVLIQKEHVSPRAAFGALIAVTGSALLFVTAQ